MRKPNNHKAFRGGGGACNPLIATVSGLLRKLGRTVCGFAKKGTKILRHYGTKKECHSELVSESHRDKMLKQVQHDNSSVIASVQRNVAIASNRDLREQNTECAVRRCNDGVGAVPIHSKACFLFSFGTFLISLIAKRKRKVQIKILKRDCFATLAMTSKCSFAFTLSEVLIVLAVLGVVAAMTIPSLIQDAQEKALITALKKNYSVFSQALEMAVAENGAPSTWDFGTFRTGAQKLFDILKPYLRIEKECGTIKTGCFATTYKVLGDGADTYWQPDTVGLYARGVLASGASFHTYWEGMSNASGMIGVDVNGKAGPNKNGVDYFWFIILPDGVLEPYGKSYIRMAALIPTCLYNVSGNISNGFGCTYWAIKYENMDYRRKSGKYLGY